MVQDRLREYQKEYLFFLKQTAWLLQPYWLQDEMADVVMQKKAKGKHLNVNDLEQFKTAAPLAMHQHIITYGLFVSLFFSIRSTSYRVLIACRRNGFGA